MKNIKPKLIRLFKQGFCTPQISRLAKTINEPSTTIYYNIKKLESEGAIRAYRAVFDYGKINEGFCAYVLVNVSPSEYEHDWPKYETSIVRELAKHSEVESLDVITGEWDMILKVRARDQNEFYKFLANVVNRIAIQKSISLVSLKQVKSDFILQ